MQKGISEATGISTPQINDCIKGRKSVSEEKRRLIVDKIPDFIDWCGTYDDFLDLGRWILLGKDGDDWPGVIHAVMDLTEPGVDTATARGTPEPSNVSLAPKKQSGNICKISAITNKDQFQITEWINTQDEPGRIWIWVSVELEDKFPDFAEFLKKTEGAAAQNG